MKGCCASWASKDGADESAEQLRTFLLNVELITLRNNRLILTMPSGEVRDLGLDLQLSREGSFRRVEATLSSSRGARIAVLAQGVGDPFQPETLFRAGLREYSFHGPGRNKGAIVG